MESLPEGALFRSQTCEGGTRYFSYAEVAKFMADRRYKAVKDYYTPQYQKLLATNGGEVLITDLPKKSQALIRHKYETVMSVRRIVGDKLAPTDADWIEAIEIHHTEYRNRLDSLLLLTKGMSITTEQFRKPTLASVRNWDLKLRNGGDHPIALRDGRHRSGDRTERYDPAQLAIIERHIRGWLTERQASKISQFHVLTADFYLENLNRLERGMPKLEVPSRSAWYRRLDDLDDYVVVAMRQGIDAANRMYRSTGRGLGVARPGSVSEMDGWVIDLMTLIGETSDEWKQLTDKEKAKAKALRFVVIVIMDVATRCITGVHFCRAENTTAANGAMRLSLEVKTELVKILGLRSDWPAYSAGMLSTDNGGPFISDEVSTRALDAFGNVQRTVAGIPWLRPHIERFFRTLSRQFIEFFIGRTFSNPQERDEYDAQKRASVTIDTFNEKLIKWVIEVYHHTFQKELGMTPYAFWQTRREICPPPPPMDRGRIAAIFGTRVRRVLYGESIQVANQHYNSVELQKVMRTIGLGAELNVNVDPENLGEIAVEVPVRTVDEVGRMSAPGMGWITVPGPEALRGASIWQLEKARENLQLLAAPYEKDSEDIRLRAIAELYGLGEENARARFSRIAPSDAAMERALSGYFPGLKSDKQPVAEDLLAKLRQPIKVRQAPAETAPPPSIWTGDSDSEPQIEIDGGD